MSKGDSAPSSEPEARTETLRRAIVQALRDAELSAKELSALIGLREREVAEHLEHLGRSLRHASERLVVRPPRCVACDFAFEDRERLGKPSRCPRCKRERIQPARFRIEAEP